MVIFRVPLVLAVFLSTVVNFTLSADTGKLTDDHHLGLNTLHDNGIKV